MHESMIHTLVANFVRGACCMTSIIYAHENNYQSGASCPEQILCTVARGLASIVSTYSERDSHHHHISLVQQQVKHASPSHEAHRYSFFNQLYIILSVCISSAQR